MISRILYEAFQPPMPTPDAEAPPGSICAITGQALQGPAMRLTSVMTSATSAVHEQCAAPESPYVSLDAAACYKASARSGHGISGNLYAAEGHDGLRPMISSASGEAAGRPVWQSLVYGTTPGLATDVPSVAIFTDEFHRRLWLTARVSYVGDVWKPYLHTGSVSRTLSVSLTYLRQVLALCEHAYALGFSKDAIATTLTSAPLSQIQEVGFVRTRFLDRNIAQHRGTDELLLATFIVQRPPTDMGLEAPEETQCLIPPTPPSSQRPTTLPAPPEPAGLSPNTLFD